MASDTNRIKSSRFTRTPKIGVCLDGFSQDEQAEVMEAMRGVSQLTVPFILHERFSPQEFVGYDALFVAPEYITETLRAGFVPISQNEEGCQDYQAIQEQGNGFFYGEKNRWEMFASIIRMLETYQFPYDWENLRREVKSFRRK